MYPSKPDKNDLPHMAEQILQYRKYCDILNVEPSTVRLIKTELDVLKDWWDAWQRRMIEAFPFANPKDRKPKEWPGELFGVKIELDDTVYTTMSYGPYQGCPPCNGIAYNPCMDTGKKV